MRIIKPLLLILLIAGTITHCNNLSSSQDADLHFQGEVSYMEIEGGFWAIKTNQETYEPTNLTSAFQEDGLKVTVSANVQENMGSVRMVGPIIHIVDISKR